MTGRLARLLPLMLGLVLSAGAWAAPWEFSPAIPVTRVHGPGIFHHLESAGRKNVAVAGSRVAVAWSDNHARGPRIYAAFKSAGDGHFTPARQLSGDTDAYEPSIAALPHGQFLVGWEEDSAVWLRRISPTDSGPAVRLGAGHQISLGARGGTVYAVWAGPPEQGDAPADAATPGQIRVARIDLRADGLQVKPGTAVAVEHKPPPAPQLYPSVAVTPAGVVVAWEDRREGHTRLFTSFSADGQSFSTPRPLNELLRPRSEKFGRGTGVTRVTLAPLPDGDVVAAWMDKRYFRSGYDIYAAFSHDGGRTFGHNQRVEDDFGDTYGQWHPAVAVAPDGTVTVAWDDNRDGTQDLWLSWTRGKGQWSADFEVPPAAGDGQQSNPAMAFDSQGNLHLAWIAQQRDNGPTRLLYSEGRLKQP